MLCRLTRYIYFFNKNKDYVLDPGLGPCTKMNKTCFHPTRSSVSNVEDRQSNTSL